MTTATQDNIFTIEPATQEWAYQEIQDDFRARRYVWREVSEDFYEQALGVLPPIYVRGGFCVGEAWSSNANGEPLYAVFAYVNGHCYATISSEHGFAWRRTELGRLLAATTR